ncbi:MAG: hypothetical protein M1819_000431 [Sarea resinae]|nr:MAG: hypothetical protein M1819_000431 [Sarea resinae]
MAGSVLSEHEGQPLTDGLRGARALFGLDPAFEFKCFGTGRKGPCGRTVGEPKRTEIGDVLDIIDAASSYGGAVVKAIEIASRNLYCCYHHDQAEDLASEWREKLIRTLPNSSRSPVLEKPKGGVAEAPQTPSPQNKSQRNHYPQSPTARSVVGDDSPSQREDTTSLRPPAAWKGQRSPSSTRRNSHGSLPSTPASSLGARDDSPTSDVSSIFSRRSRSSSPSTPATSPPNAKGGLVEQESPLARRRTRSSVHGSSGTLLSSADEADDYTSPNRQLDYGRAPGAPKKDERTDLRKSARLAGEDPPRNEVKKPRFVPYHEPLTSLIIAQKIKRRLTGTLGVKSLGKGYVYTFTRDEDPGFIKLGFTRVHSEGRVEGYRQCGNCTAYLKSSEDTPHPYHVEQLVFSELAPYRRKESSGCNGGNGCGKAHEEWLETSQEKVRDVLAHWLQFAKYYPYGSGRYLTKNWTEHLICVTDAIRLGKEVCWKDWIHAFQEKESPSIGPTLSIFESAASVAIEPERAVKKAVESVKKSAVKSRNSKFKELMSSGYEEPIPSAHNLKPESTPRPRSRSTSAMERATPGTKPTLYEDTIAQIRSSQTSSGWGMSSSNAVPEIKVEEADSLLTEVAQISADLEGDLERSEAEEQREAGDRTLSTSKEPDPKPLDLSSQEADLAFALSVQESVVWSAQSGPSRAATPLIEDDQEKSSSPLGIKSEDVAAALTKGIERSDARVKTGPSELSKGLPRSPLLTGFVRESAAEPGSASVEAGTKQPGDLTPPPQNPWEASTKPLKDVKPGEITDMLFEGTLKGESVTQLDACDQALHDVLDPTTASGSTTSSQSSGSGEALNAPPNTPPAAVATAVNDKSTSASESSSHAHPYLHSPVPRAISTFTFSAQDFANNAFMAPAWSAGNIAAPISASAAAAAATAAVTASHPPPYLHSPVPRAIPSFTFSPQDFVTTTTGTPKVAPAPNLAPPPPIPPRPQDWRPGHSAAATSLPSLPSPSSLDPVAVPAATPAAVVPGPVLPLPTTELADGIKAPAS